MKGGAHGETAAARRATRNRERIVSRPRYTKLLIVGSTYFQPGVTPLGSRLDGWPLGRESEFVVGGKALAWRRNRPVTHVAE